MERTVVGDAQPAWWQWLIRSLRCARRLELIESSLISKTGNILENGGARVAIGICNRIIHKKKRLAIFAILGGDDLAPLFRGEPLPIKLAKLGSHRGRHPNSLDLADFRKALPAKSEPLGRTFAGFGSRFAHGPIIAQTRSAYRHVRNGYPTFCRVSQGSVALRQRKAIAKRSRRKRYEESEDMPLERYIGPTRCTPAFGRRSRSCPRCLTFICPQIIDRVLSALRL